MHIGYLHLHSCGADAFQMVHVSYVLTVSVSKISFKHDDRDVALFEGMVTSMVCFFFLIAIFNKIFPFFIL